MHCDKHFSEFLPTSRQKSTGTNMEQNYVTVTLCIDRSATQNVGLLTQFAEIVHDNGQ